MNLVTGTVYNDILSPPFDAGALRAVEPLLGDSHLRIVRCGHQRVLGIREFLAPRFSGYVVSVLY